MALVSGRVRSTSIEAHEFSELAGHYDVYAVPKIIVNDRWQFTGALPEPQFVDTILEAVRGAEPEVSSGEATPLSGGSPA